MDPKQSDALDRVMDLVRFLRTHCPWDAAQTPRSLVPYLLEEAHESAEAITDGDDDALRSELGDLLLNIAFQIVLAEERSAFDAAAVAETVTEKMRRRHPHLYGLGEAEEWERMKARERGPDASILQGVARGLDPLSRAHRIQDRVATVGFDWADAAGALAKVEEELEEVREVLEVVSSTSASASASAPEQASTSTSTSTSASASASIPTSTSTSNSNSNSNSNSESGRESGGEAGSGGGADAGLAEGEEAALEEELGDLLFAVVNLTRLAGAHPVTALQRANAKFARRFRMLEDLARDRGLVLDAIGLEALDVLWDEVKRTERTGGGEEQESP